VFRPLRTSEQCEGALHHILLPVEIFQPSESRWENVERVPHKLCLPNCSHSGSFDQFVGKEAILSIDDDRSNINEEIIGLLELSRFPSHVELFLRLRSSGNSVSRCLEW
jgi:hypothetical protein